MYWSFNLFVVQSTLFFGLLHFPQTESLIGLVKDRKGISGPISYPDGASYTASIEKIETKGMTIERICTGVLISIEHVLVPAECIKNQQDHRIRVFLGCQKLHLCTAYAIKTWKTYDRWASEHDIYNKVTEHSIAIITLSVPTSDLNIKLPNLHFKSNPKVLNSILVLVGWVKSNNDSSNIILQSSTVRILSQIDCETKLSEIESKIVQIEESRYFCTEADSRALGDYRKDNIGSPVFDQQNYFLGFSVKRYLTIKDHHHRLQAVHINIDIDFYNDFIRDVVKSDRLA